MVQVPYRWVEGAILQNHSKKKHQVLRRYLAEYLQIRCILPQQSRFRLAIIDGFAGGGAYHGGEPGSPLIFLELLLEQTLEINIQRAADGMAQIQFECLLIFNDLDVDAMEILKLNVAPLQEKCKLRDDLNVEIIFMNEAFETAYPQMKRHLSINKISRNVFLVSINVEAQWFHDQRLLTFSQHINRQKCFLTLLRSRCLRTCRGIILKR